MAKEIKIGDRVKANGHTGTIIGHDGWGALPWLLETDDGSGHFITDDKGLESIGWYISEAVVEKIIEED